MDMISKLPAELQAIILSYKDISIEDEINFRLTCKQFRMAAQYEKHWEKKFSQRWSSAKKLFDKKPKENEQKESDNESGQKDENNFICKSLFVKTGINFARQLQCYRSEILHKHYDTNNLIDNFTSFKQVFQLDEHLNEIFSKPENFINNSFFIDEIRSSLAQSSRKTDLTERYYNKKMFDYLRQCSVKEKWEKFKEQPQEKQLLERAATIFAQWFQPEKDILYSCIKESLNTIAQEVLNCLRKKNPDHSIFSTSTDNFSYWENNNIDDNHWNEEEGTQIMDAVEEYIFKELEFRASRSKNTILEDMFIDNVLKNKYGQEVLILIIYHSVARRLGLRCDVRKLPFTCNTCIFWKPKYVTNNPNDVRCFNTSFDDTHCPIRQQNPSTEPFVITAKEAMMQLLLLEVLMHLDGQSHTLMAMPQEIFEYVWITNLKEISLHIENTEQSNVRPEEVKFAVGMIVTHNKNKYDGYADTPSTGVIIGWHKYADRCNVKYSKNKILTPVLPLKIYINFNDTKQQAGYLILTEKNEICYVGEDDITLTTPKWIDNSEIGRYFCKYEDTHYVPNKMLSRCYPQDAAVIARTISSE